MRWMGLVGVLEWGCAGDDGPTRSVDTASSHGTDTDTDTGPRTPTPDGCPFDGSWAIVEVSCNEQIAETTGTVQVTGTEALCQLEITATLGAPVVEEPCPIVEHVDLHALSFGFWNAYTDAAGEPACADGNTGPRDVGVIELSQSDSRVELMLAAIEWDDYLQVTACAGLQRVVLGR